LTPPPRVLNVGIVRGREPDGGIDSDCGTEKYKEAEGKNLRPEPESRETKETRKRRPRRKGRSGGKKPEARKPEAGRRKEERRKEETRRTNRKLKAEIMKEAGS
jgi:hypothetical protein